MSVFKRRFGSILSVTLLIYLLAPVANAAQDFSSQANHAYSIEDSFRLRGKEFDYEHEIRVALPPSYRADGEKSYPVLWVTDSSVSFELVVGVLNLLTMGRLSPEIIVVGVGAPGSATYEEFVSRRTMDFSPSPVSKTNESSGNDYLHDQPEVQALLNLPKRADAFLNLLVEQLRPGLAKKYRMSGDHALFGHSYGGLFASYVLVARPSAFSKYLIGSPVLNIAADSIFALENEYTMQHKDIEAEIFFGAGGKELNNAAMSEGGVVVTMLEFATLLKSRSYPSLNVQIQIFEGRDHFTALGDLFMHGIPALWHKEVKGLVPLFG